MRCFQKSLIILAVIQAIVSTAAAQEKSPGLVKQLIVLNSVGDAECEMEMRLPTDAYTSLKVNNPNTAVLLRRLGWGFVPQQTESERVEFRDADSTIHIEWKTKGLASIREGRWELPLDEIARGYAALTQTNRWTQPLTVEPRIELIRAKDNEILLTQSISHYEPTAVRLEHPMAGMSSAGTALTQIKTHDSCENAKIIYYPKRLIFDRATTVGADCGGCDKVERGKEHTQTTKPAARLEVHVDFQPRLMSCLAKSYGTEAASTFWGARLVARNVGQAGVEKFKARFQVGVSAEAEWTPWQEYDVLLSGQTITVPFYPLLDPHTLSKNDSTQRAYARVEYSFLNEKNEETVRRVERPIEILSRNDVLFSSFTNDQALGVIDGGNNVPVVLASMATRDDPVVQMVAGRISGMAGNIAASDSDDNAIRYLEAIHTFITSSRIAYQTPPTALFNSNLTQHVKFARDVFRNRAGTCIDLAITYASLSEAVGLEPLLIVTNNHVFPAIVLPESRRVFAVESVCVTGSFAAAAAEGKRKWELEGNKPDNYVINIRQLHDQGIHPLDLPPVDVQEFEKWGMSFPKVVPTPTSGSANGRPQPSEGPAFSSGISSTTGSARDTKLAQLEKQVADLLLNVKKNDDDRRRDRESSRREIQTLTQQLNDANLKLAEAKPNKRTNRNGSDFKSSGLPFMTSMTKSQTARTSERGQNVGPVYNHPSPVVRGPRVGSAMPFGNNRSVVMDSNGMKIEQADGSILVMDGKGMRIIRN